MPNFIECLDMGVFTKTEESTINLINFVMQKGEPMMGYYGCPYMNYHFGDAQFIVRSIVNEEKKQLVLLEEKKSFSGYYI